MNPALIKTAYPVILVHLSILFPQGMTCASLTEAGLSTFMRFLPVWIVFYIRTQPYWVNLSLIHLHLSSCCYVLEIKWWFLGRDFQHCFSFVSFPAWAKRSFTGGLSMFRAGLKAPQSLNGSYVNGLYPPFLPVARDCWVNVQRLCSLTPFLWGCVHCVTFLHSVTCRNCRGLAHSSWQRRKRGHW